MARAGEAEQASERGAPGRGATIDEQRQQGLDVRQSQGPCESLGQAASLSVILSRSRPARAHPSAGSPSGSATPGLTRVPSTHLREPYWSFTGSDHKKV